MLFALWFTTLAMTPPTLVAMRKTIQYPFLQKAPLEVIEQISTADRSFFIVYGMLATALLASLTWDALFPDRTDQEIVGVLPVRPRTLAAARLAAGMTIGTAFAAAVNLPAAIIYSLASASHPLLGALPRVLAAHVVTTMMACACTFLGLMSLRALVAICAGERIADRLALVLQFVTIVLLVETFLFLPAVLPDIIDAMQEGRASYAWVPPVWFVALFIWMAEGTSFLSDHIVKAVAVTAAVTGLVVLVSLPPAAWMGRRVLEVRTIERASGLALLARRIALLWVRGPGRAQHLRVRRGESGAESPAHDPAGHASRSGDCRRRAEARAADRLRRPLFSHTPRTYTLAIPLVLMFFAVFGLRAGFAIPTELDANWVFRLVQPTVRDSVRASRWLILLLGVVPIAIVWLPVTLAMWPVQTAIGATMLTLTTGMLLTELALGNWTKIPFASAHAPATDTIKSRWPLYVFGLIVYQFALPNFQLIALRSWRSTLVQLGIGVALIVAVRTWRARTLRHRTPTFDVVGSEAIMLNLSEAAS